MKRIYACLLGNWVCLNDDENCKIGTELESPSQWFENGARVYAPMTPNLDYEHSYYGLNYVQIIYKGVSHRINPMFIQIVGE